MNRLVVYSLAAALATVAGPVALDAQESSPQSTGEVLVRLETPHGTIVIAVDPVHAPITAANFLRYVDGGFYDGGRFHRATREDNYTPAPPNRPMMNIIQGGINPARNGDKFDPIPLERTTVTGIKHVRGVVSMARGGPDSATSDFFILLDDQPSLDMGGMRFDDGQGAAAFGRVVEGLDVVETIQQQPVQGQNLTPPVPITRAVRMARGSVAGRVTDHTGAPAPGVLLFLCPVTMEARQRAEVSSLSGEFAFAALAAGAYTLEVELTGYQPLSIPVTVVNDRVVYVEPTIRPKPEPLPVTVTVGTPRSSCVGVQ